MPREGAKLLIGARLGPLPEAPGGETITGRASGTLTFAHEHQVLLLVHGATGVPVDLSFAWLPFEWEALGAATEKDFDGVPIRVATAEDLIVMKSVAMREQDRLDILDLLVRHGDRVRLDRIRRLVAEFAAVLKEPERIAQFEDLAWFRTGKFRVTPWPAIGTPGKNTLRKAGS